MKKNPYMTARVTRYQNKRGIQYATVDGGLYRFLKILYILSFAANLLFNLFYILVKLVSLDVDGSQSSDISGLIEISGFTALLIAGLVLLLFLKTRFAGIFASIAALAASAVTLGFITAASGSAAEADTKTLLGLPLYFILRHALPALIGIILLLLMLLIDILAVFKYSRLYKRLEAELYTQYLAQVESPTDEGWLEYLKGENNIEL